MRRTLEAYRRAGVAARAIASVEDETVRYTTAACGTLARALNLRVAAWGTEARAEVEEDASWSGALPRAAEDTIIPYCCARDGQGAIETFAANTVRDLVRRQTQRL